MAERALQHGKSLAVLGLRVSEELYRLLRAQSYARRGYVVILDRHPYADYFARRVRATDAWIRWGDRIHGLFLQWVYPRPQGLVLLDAPAEILHARKPEGSLAAVRARRQEYLDLARALPGGMLAVVDVSRPEEEVLADLVRIARGAWPLER
jgi:thymidylate kinase